MAKKKNSRSFGEIINDLENNEKLNKAVSRSLSDLEKLMIRDYIKQLKDNEKGL